MALRVDTGAVSSAGAGLRSARITRPTLPATDRLVVAVNWMVQLTMREPCGRLIPPKRRPTRLVETVVLLMLRGSGR